MESYFKTRQQKQIHRFESRERREACDNHGMCSMKELHIGTAILMIEIPRQRAM